MKSRIAIKSHARELTRTGRASPVLAGTIVLIAASVLDFLSSLFQPGTPITVGDFQYAMSSGDLSVLMERVAFTSPMQPFFPILFSLVMIVLYAGLDSFCMGIYRGEETPYSALLNGFGSIARLIWCEILMAIKVSLWSMLFVIPGFIAVYRYRFAVYNLLNDETLTASQAIALSCRQTEGVKFELFVLDLSFIGWSLLTSLTFGLLGIWTLPYMTLSDLGYYYEACARVDAARPNAFPGDETPWEH